MDGYTTSLMKSESSVLRDALKWYISEYDLQDYFVEDIEKGIEELEESDELRLDLIPGDLIREDVLKSYADELYPYINESDDPKKTGQFFEQTLKGISKKIRKAEKKQKNAFF